MKHCILAAIALLLVACQTTDPDIRALPKPDFFEAPPPTLMTAEPKSQSIRFATYNSSLYSDDDGGLIKRLQNEDVAAKKIAAVIQHQRPDILLVNEFDYDAEGLASELFQKRFLAVSQDGQDPISYPYFFIAPVNTGVPSGLDLNNDGKTGGSGRERGDDAFGYGLHPGQYGMLVLSRYPIDSGKIRTFQKLLWKDLPNPMMPKNPETKAPWYKPEAWAGMRLSSKSHLDVPINTPNGIVHFLVSHPTPPVFDGPEDRNGNRNHDEIKLWAEYLSNQNTHWLCDDKGVCGGLASDARFVIAGDLNADPVDGDGVPGAVRQLLDHPRVLKSPAPKSEGAAYSAQTVGQGNLGHKGDHAEDTGDFGPKVGNMRLDYVLPSANIAVTNSGVFWLKPGDAGYQWMDASDHHMVWVDVEF
ncbi:MAG: endonuclease/exonuclease/phosphatase family protein [Arenimonas sp.]